MKEYIISTRDKEVMQEVNLLDIVPLKNFNPREELDQSLIEKLAKIDYVPAIKLAKFKELSDKLIIIDGNHRYNSRFLKGDETINAIIYEFDNEADLFKEATLANIVHGKMLTKEEKIKAISRIIKYNEEKTDKIVFAQLATELGGLDVRELRKIYTWTVMEKVLTPEQFEFLGLNIAKADILYRLYKHLNNDVEFRNFFDRYASLKFGDLNNAINKYMSGEPIALETVANDKIEVVEGITDEILKDEITNQLELETKEIEEAIKKEETMEFNVIEQLEDIDQLIEEKKYLIDFAKQNDAEINKDGFVTVIDSLINKLNTMKESINVL